MDSKAGLVSVPVVQAGVVVVLVAMGACAILRSRAAPGVPPPSVTAPVGPMMGPSTQSASLATAEAENTALRALLRDQEARLARATTQMGSLIEGAERQRQAAGALPGPVRGPSGVVGQPAGAGTKPAVEAGVEAAAGNRTGDALGSGRAVQDELHEKVAGKRGHVQHAGDVRVELIGCEREGAGLRCLFMATNEGTDRRLFLPPGEDGNGFYDQRGRHYAADLVSIAETEGWRARQMIIEGVPTRLGMIFKQVASGTTSIARLNLAIGGDIAQRGAVLAFRGVAILEAGTLGE